MPRSSMNSMPIGPRIFVIELPSVPSAVMAVPTHADVVDENGKTALAALAAQMRALRASRERFARCGRADRDTGVAQDLCDRSHISGLCCGASMPRTIALMYSRGSLLVEAVSI